MVLMHADPAATEAMTAEERAEVFRGHDRLHEDLAGTGEMRNGAGLALPRDATTIRRAPPSRCRCRRMVTGGDGAGPVRHRPPAGIRRSDLMHEMCNMNHLGEYWTNGRDV